MQGSQKNIYGGTIYGQIDSTRNDYQTLDKTEYSSGFTVGYKQSLFRKFGKLYNNTSLFSTKEKIKLLTLFNKDEKANIILKSVTYYYDTILNSEKIKIQKKALIRAQSNYDAAKAKQESGLVSKVDVYRAKLSYLDQNRNLNDSIKRYKDSLENLYFYINQDVDINNSFSESQPIIIIENSLENKKDSKILAENIKWNNMLLDEKLLKKEIYKSNKDFLPDLELDMKYKQFAQKEELDNSFNFNEDSWSIGINSNYNFNTTEQSITKQRLLLEKTKLKRDKYSLNRLIFKDINSLQNDYKNIIENLKIYKLKEKEAENSLKVSKIRYERGLSSNLDILDAESSYSSSQIDYVSEVLKYNLTLLKYAKAINSLDLEFINKVIK
ncbi:MAG: TolC family protein [Campylobacterota bacterium]|nr:TolC family protein [Campylobacterota bacterium]